MPENFGTAGQMAVRIFADEDMLDRALRDEIPKKAEAGGTYAAKQFKAAFGPKLKKGAEDAAGEAIDALKARWKRQVADAKEELARGLIDERQFRSRGEAAARQLNQGILSQIETLSRSGKLTDEMFVRLTDELHTVGIRGGKKMGEGILSGMQSPASRITRFFRSFFLVGLVGTATFAVRRIGQLFEALGRKIRDALTLGGNIQGRLQSFRGLATAQGLDPEKLLGELRRGVRATASDFELLERSNNALQAGLVATEQQFGEIATVTRRLGQSVGIDAADAFEKFVNGIVHNRKIILSVLGLVVDWKGAYDAYAKSVGKSADQLTALEKQQVRLTATLAAARKEVAGLGPDTLNAAQRVEQLGTAWTNMKNAAALAFADNERIRRLLDDWAGSAEQASENMDHLAARIGALVDVAVNRLTTLKGLALTLKDFGAALQAAAVGNVGGALQSFRGLRQERNAAEQKRLQDIQQQQAVDQIRASKTLAEVLGRRAAIQKQINGLTGQEENFTQQIGNLHGQLVATFQTEARLRAKAAEDALKQREEAEKLAAALKAQAFEEAVKAADRILADLQKSRDAVEGLSIGGLTSAGTKAEIQAGGAAPGAPDPQALERARREIEQILDSSGSVQEKSLAIEGVFQKWGVTLGQFLPVIQKWVQAVFQAAEGSDSAESGFQKILRAASKFEPAARGILSVADSLGVVDENARKALQGVIDLSDAAGQFAKGNAIGGIVEGIGGIAGIVGGLFGGGPSPEEQHRLQVLQQNTAALERLTSSLDRQAQIAGGTPGSTLQGLQQVAATPGLLQEGSGIANTIQGFTGIARLRAILKQVGLSVSDLEDFAQQAGINISNLAALLRGSSGDIQGAEQEFSKLKDEINAISLSDLGKTFASRMDLLREKFQLFGTTLTDQAAQIRDALLQFTDLPADIRKKLQAADLSTPEGRKAAQDALQQVFQLIESGQLPVSALGNLDLGQLRDGIDTLNETLQQANDQAQQGGASGQVTSFQLVDTITRQQADAMTSMLSTDVYWNQKTAEGVSELIRIAGGTPSLPGKTVTPASAGSGRTAVPAVQVGRIDVSAPVSVEGAGGDPATVAATVSRSLLRELDRSLGDALLRALRNSGQPPTRTV